MQTERHESEVFEDPKSERLLRFLTVRIASEIRRRFVTVRVAVGTIDPRWGRFVQYAALRFSIEWNVGHHGLFKLLAAAGLL